MERLDKLLSSTGRWSRKEADTHTHIYIYFGYI